MLGSAPSSYRLQASPMSTLNKHLRTHGLFQVVARGRGKGSSGVVSVFLAMFLASAFGEERAAVGPRVPVGPEGSFVCPSSSVNLSPEADVQKIVRAHPAGTRYCFAAGTYAQLQITPKTGDGFFGQKGAVLDGGHAVAHAFLGSANDVTIQNLVVQNYATRPQDAPINNRKAKGLNWIISHNEIAYNDGAGIEAGSGTQIVANFLHHNRQEGYACSGEGVVIADNEIAFNNPDDAIDTKWEAGGGKCANTIGLLVQYNYSHDNHGPGLWTDIDNREVRYEYNLVEKNWREGIYHEISWDAVIAHNIVRNNGNLRYCRGWLWCSGIQIAASGGVGDRIVDIYDNTVVSDGQQHGNAIALTQQNRGEGLNGTHLVQNVHVHDNRIDMSAGGGAGAVTDIGDVELFSGRGNSFDRDHYVGAGPHSFTWNSKWGSFTWFQKQQQEMHGSSQ
jgi:parallel beta-helix repeat protein